MVKMRMKRSDNGHRIGDSHHNATLTDHEIELARQLHTDGMHQAEVARKMGMSKGYASKVLRYKARRGR